MTLRSIALVVVVTLAGCEEASQSTGFKCACPVSCGPDVYLCFDDQCGEEHEVPVWAAREECEHLALSCPETAVVGECWCNEEVCDG